MEIVWSAERVIANKFDDPTLRFSENMAITIGSGNDSTYKLNYVSGLTSSSIELTREGKKEAFKIPFIDKASLLNCATA
ncbi:MAG: hypothetical protein IPG08_10240 [Sphingobacteriaceae bacterium]|nr:hypothetical protein [Sphingobacteriaceae bacterium]